jgi:hypothetical protein
VIRDNQNVGTELAAEGSLHPISCSAASGVRAGAPPARQACVAAATRGPGAPVVTTSGPRGGAINEDTKNAAEAPHTATVFPLDRKINVGLRSAAGDAFFPRWLGARQSYHWCPYEPLGDPMLRAYRVDPLIKHIGS